MCMEDIRLGRELGTQTRAIPLASSTLTKIAEIDDGRTRLILGIDPASQVWFGPQSSQPAANRGYVLNTAHPTEVLRVEDWGPKVTEAWYAFADGVGLTIMVTECYLGKA